MTPLARVAEIRLSGNALRRLDVLDLTLVVHPKLRRAAERVVVRPATPHELHYACDSHNWDDGTKLLAWAVRQPACDPATALLIYFRARPNYPFGLRRPDASQVETIAWLRSLEARFARSAFAPVSVAYDPAADVGAEEVLGKHVPRPMNMRATAVAGSPPYRFPRVAG